MKSLNSLKFLLLFLSIISLTYEDQFLFSERLLTIKSVNKCFCPVGEVIFEGACQKREVRYHVLANSKERTTKLVKSSEIWNPTINNISCPDDYFNVTLPDYKFALLENGSIIYIHSEISLIFENYCIESYSEETGEIITNVKVCLKTPNVPICCHDPECPFDLEENLFVPSVLDGIERSIPVMPIPVQFNCDSDSNLTETHLMNEDAYGKIQTTFNYYEGNITFSPQSVKTLTYNFFEYCLNSVEGMFSIKYCVQDPFLTYQQECKEKLCFTKCCKQNLLFNMDEFGCRAGVPGELWKPNFYDESDFSEVYITPNSTEYKVFYDFPHCGTDSYILDPESTTKTVLKLLRDGFLYEEEGETFWEPLHYCIDNFKSGSKIVEKALVCFKETSEAIEKCEESTGIAYIVLLILSSICLTATLVVYIILPELSSKLQGKSLISNVVALLTSYMLLITVQLAHDQLTDNGCAVLALLMQFSFLASFFWINIMSYDMWRTFRTLKIKKESPTGSRRRFFLYSLYAWGCPFVISTVTGIMQFTAHKDDADGIIRPNFSQMSCFLSKNDARVSWIYFYGFVAVIVVVNIFFYSQLAWILVKARKATEFAKSGRKQHEQYTAWAKLYLKLFIIMGVTWIFEVTSHVEGSCSLWIFTDIINTLQGVFIFVIFVCKKNTLKKIRTKGVPAITRMRSTLQRSSSFFSRSSKRTSNSYYGETTLPRNQEETNFVEEQSGNEPKTHD